MALLSALIRAASWLLERPFRCGHKRVSLPYNERQRCLDCGAWRHYIFNDDFEHAQAGIFVGDWRKDEPATVSRITARRIIEQSIAPVYRPMPRNATPALEWIPAVTNRIMDRHTLNQRLRDSIALIDTTRAAEKAAARQ